MITVQLSTLQRLLPLGYQEAYLPLQNVWIIFILINMYVKVWYDL